MRFTSLTTPILLILLPLLASAGGPPACALTCVQKSLGSQTACGKPRDMEKRLGEHLPCLCKDKIFLAAYDNCIVSSGDCKH